MNLNTKQKQKFVKIIVIIVSIGVVGAYIPLLFTPNNSVPQDANGVNNALPQNGEQTVQVPIIPKTNSTSVQTPTPSSTVPVKLEPQGFKGLNEEGQSLDELNKLLNQ